MRNTMVLEAWRRSSCTRLSLLHRQVMRCQIWSLLTASCSLRPGPFVPLRTESDANFSVEPITDSRGRFVTTLITDYARERALASPTGDSDDEHGRLDGGNPQTAANGSSSDEIRQRVQALLRSLVSAVFTRCTLLLS